MASETFTKLESRIIGSTIWTEDDHTRLLWITMLALADRDGYVGASIPGLASLARIPLESAERAIEKFLAPDKYSRSQEHEGRRIVVADRGWTLLNYARIRGLRETEERKEYERDRKRAYRARTNDGKTYVYFARDERNLIKIGYSENPINRTKSFNLRASGAVGEVEVLAVIEGKRSDEMRLHEQFESLRFEGEWFHAGPKLMDFIRASSGTSLGREGRGRSVPARPAMSAQAETESEAETEVDSLDDVVRRQGHEEGVAYLRTVLSTLAPKLRPVDDAQLLKLIESFDVDMMAVAVVERRQYLGGKGVPYLIKIFTERVAEGVKLPPDPRAYVAHAMGDGLR